jgi:Putative Flp pilus-assembly TadE/G-like
MKRMKRWIHAFRRDNKAASVPFVAVTIVLLLTAAGVAIDLGHLYVVKQELQSAAEAGALAGVRNLFALNDPDVPTQAEIRCVDALASALATVRANSADGQPLDIRNQDVNYGLWEFKVQADGTNKWVFTPQTICTAEINAVQVVTMRTAAVNGPVNLFFGSFLGKANQELRATATAMLGWVGSLPEGFAFPLAIGYQYVPKIVGERRPVTFSNDWSDTGGWHCFESISADSAELKNYVSETLITPGIAINDFISMLNGVSETVNHAAAITLKQYQQRGEPWIVYLPVIDATKFNQTQEVLGFCAFEIENVDKSTKAISGDALGMYLAPGMGTTPTNPNPNNSLRDSVPHLVQ